METDVDDVSVQSDTDSCQDVVMVDYFTNMSFEPYGRGYLLTPPEGHPQIGMKYYHNGWWNNTLGGWIFRRSSRERLLDHGADEFA